MVSPRVAALIDAALEEDFGRGDATSEAVLDPGAMARGVILAKQRLVLAGLDIAEEVFRRVDPTVECERLVSDGDEVAAQTEVVRLSGAAHALLGAERTALNFLQRMSGIATLTRAFVRAVDGTRAVILDTRKTVPGWRELDKLAVRLGGGQNHRPDLASGILIKDNHIAAVGAVGEAVTRAKAWAPPELPVAVEVSNAVALDEALAAGTNLVLLDNLSPAEAAALTARVAGRAVVEVSGGVRLDNVRAYAEAGVDRISVGALTHSVPAADLSLEIDVAPRG